MKYNPDLHHRTSIRIKNYDYSQNGVYFITIFVKNRQCLFGAIDDNKMILNEFGIIVRDEWVKSFQIRKELEMDEYVIMPNHFHGIVSISYRKSTFYFSLSVCDKGPKNKSIGSLMAGFKSIVTSKINKRRRQSIGSIWQRNYHEHVIRNEESLQKIREYTRNNPYTWEKDSLRENNL